MVVALALACVLGRESNAQASSAHVVEIEGLYGHTAVDVEKWAQASPVDRRNMAAYGVNARVLFLFIGNAHAGFELGSHHLFRYELFTQIGTSITREKHVVAAQHWGIVTRFDVSRKLALDVGFGFHYLKRSVLPGLQLGLTYPLFERAKLSVPLGARMDLIPDNEVTAVPLSLRSGLSIKL
jgi:hypothetical protein